MSVTIPGYRTEKIPAELERVLTKIENSIKQDDSLLPKILAVVQKQGISARKEK